MKNKQIYVFLILLSFCNSKINGQAWTKPTGKGFYKLDFSTINSNMLFDNSGEVVDAPKLSSNAISIYGEHGITNRITLNAYVPYVLNKTDDQSMSSIGDIDLGVTVGILQKTRVVWSVGALLGLPTGKKGGPNELVTGDGEFNKMLKTNAGISGKKWWSQVYLGSNFRAKDYASELRYGGEFGYKFFQNKLLAIAKIAGISPGDEGNHPVNNFGLYSNKVSYFSPALELVYYIKPEYGIALRGAGAGTGATNIQASPQFSVSFFYDRK